MQKGPRLRVPVSTFAKFCAAEDDKSRRNLVKGAKSRTGKNGGDYYARFKRVVKTACQMGNDIDAVEDDLTTQVVNVEPEKTRLPLLRDAFLDQWRKHGYQFFAVHGKDVTVARLTLKVAPDLGVLTRAGDEIAVKLWLSEGDVFDRKRDTFIYLMSEAKRMAQWPLVWRYAFGNSSEVESTM